MFYDLLKKEKKIQAKTVNTQFFKLQDIIYWWFVKTTQEVMSSSERNRWKTAEYKVRATFDLWHFVSAFGPNT